jgi:hypothetical protein
MNSLKTVAEKVKRSPQVIRKKFAGQFESQNQHQGKLSQQTALNWQL